MTTSRLLPSLWAGFDRLHGEMGRFFDNWDLPRHLGLSTSLPSLNVWEDGDAYHIEAEVPGMTQEQVQISVTQRNQVSITGERAADESTNGRWHRRERTTGRFQRLVKLPAPVDAEKVEAKLENGVLEVTLPKAEEAKPRRIVVKA